MALAVSSREKLEELIAAIQAVVDRHDILRTAVLWEGLPQPVQVVYREARVPVEELEPLRADAREQVREWLRAGGRKMDLRQAPLMRLEVAADRLGGQWYVRWDLHHILCDHLTHDIVIEEVLAHLKGAAEDLPQPISYRNNVAQALAGANPTAAEAFFRGKLQDVTEPTAPFGLLDVRGDGSRIHEATQALGSALAVKMRTLARRCAVSVATLFHAAWALVLARASGRSDVVFGSVLLGRLHGGMDTRRTLGMFINTLPLRLRLAGVSARELIECTQKELVELLMHEQDSLALAQRCSGIGGSAPLFSSLLNYRHSTPNPALDWEQVDGISVLGYQDRTSYPITFSVDDLGEGFSLTAQADRSIEAPRLLSYMITAIESLTEALENAPETPAMSLSILPQSERHQLIDGFNGPLQSFTQDKLIHELFEGQVRWQPSSIALTYAGRSMTYADLNGKANQLARYLRHKGVGPDSLVGICMERGIDMVVGLLGILKAGAAYVPMDPSYPLERLRYMMSDADPTLLVTQEHLRAKLPFGCEIVTLDGNLDELTRQITDNLNLRATGLSPQSLAYVIYTSGSTGEPKGVMVEHRHVTRLLAATDRWFGFNDRDVWTLFHSIAFDFSVWELWGALLHGGRLVVVPYLTARSPREFYQLLCAERVTVLNQTPSAFLQLSDAQAQSPGQQHSLRVVIFGGEALEPAMLRSWSARNGAERPRLVNMYGITETTVHVTYRPICAEDIASERASLIGAPIPDLRVYVLDERLEPVPVGVAGELYVSGAGVARGYLNRPELTSKRFIEDPFVAGGQQRMYKSGDLGRRRSDGSLEYLGRNDDQVKIRGYRIELGEIEAALLGHPAVKQAVVLAKPDASGEKRLQAYVVANRSALAEAPGVGAVEALRTHVVDDWEKLYQETYGTPAQSSGPSFVGWNSSYTGEPIPLAQMREWLDCTVARILAHKPQRVLEIGCGMGLLVEKLAPHCSVYKATDFSAAAIAHLERWLNGRKDLAHVELMRGSALELGNVPSRSCDTVLLNSVIQYFPDIDYLLKVLQQALRVLAPGGRIFIGDVRHMGLLHLFHSSVQLSRAAAPITVAQLRKRIGRAVAQDKELVVDPEFFRVLPGNLPGICSAEVLLKKGTSVNELTSYRYDVVLQVGEHVLPTVVYPDVDWNTELGSLAAFEAALRERRWSAVRVSAIPNLRLAREARAYQWVGEVEDRMEVGALRRRLSETRFEAMDPQILWELAEANSYDISITPSAYTCYHMELLDRTRSEIVLRTVQPRNAAKPWNAYANDPLENSFRQQLIPQLREYLRNRLPEHMLPAVWTSLQQLPLTSNGKIDRRALPSTQGRPEELGEFVAPRSEVEKALAELWAQLLQVDQVGVEDNFFELGGHSLHGMKLIVKIAERFAVHLPVAAIFEHPTITTMARAVESLQSGKDVNAARTAELEEGIV
jgi:amino acid adenylation domain-containing protein